MLEGIEILSQTPIRDNPQWVITLFIIITVICILSFILTTILVKTDVNDWIIGVSFYTCLISFACTIVCLILLIFVRVPTGEYEYKVTVDDSVSMNDFQEKYEIIRTDGKIYIVKEKE